MASARFFSWISRSLLAAFILSLAACSTTPPHPDAPAAGADVAASPWALASGAPGHASMWKHQEFPGKRASAYRSARVDGRDVVQVDAVSSASMLRNKVRVEPVDFGRLRFSWRIPALIAGADLTDRQQSDSPVRVVLAFEGDRSKFSARDGMLSELAHALTGEPMPYATLMYVWSNQSEAGTVLTNTRTSRIRKLVLESGPGKLNRWLDYERDVRADFIKAYGEEPGALVSIGIMTDTDNTETTTTAWYGPVRLLRGR